MANWFIIMVNLLFKDVEFAIYFNDIMTSSFSINKGVRQGYPFTHTYFLMWVSTSWLNKQYTMGRYKK